MSHTKTEEPVRSSDLGYTADVIVHRGVLDEGVNFIQKPYSMKALAVKVRHSLGEE